MSKQKLSEASIVRQFAQHTAKRLTSRFIKDFQRMTNGKQTSDDSGLENIWDEICVQMQSEEFLSWDAYVETARAILGGDVEALSPHERDALWLQTKQGIDWAYQEEGPHRSDYPVCIEDVIEYLWTDYVLPEADRWSNQRIRAYLDRSTRTDYPEP
jgi:hypothetical protein